MKKKTKAHAPTPGCFRKVGHYEKSRGDFFFVGGKPMGVEPMPSCEGGRGTYSGKDVCLRRLTTGPYCHGPRFLLKVEDTNQPYMACSRANCIVS